MQVGFQKRIKSIKNAKCTDRNIVRVRQIVIKLYSYICIDKQLAERCLRYDY